MSTCSRMIGAGLQQLFRSTDGLLFFFFQHALRLLAFGQLYKVLNMDPLPASKPSPRLLEGVCHAWRPLCFHVHVLVFVPFFFYIFGECARPVWRTVMLQVDHCMFSLRRRLSEEVSGGCGSRRQRLYQKDERWLWPLTLLFGWITAGSDNLNPPSNSWAAAAVEHWTSTLLCLCAASYFKTLYIIFKVFSLFLSSV